MKDNSVSVDNSKTFQKKDDVNIPKQKTKNNFSDKELLKSVASLKKITNRSLEISGDESRLEINKKPKIKEEEDLNDSNLEDDHSSNFEDNSDYLTLHHNKNIFEEIFDKDDDLWKIYYNLSTEFIPKAFAKENELKNECSQIFLKMALDQGVFKNENEFNTFTSEKCKIAEKTIYSVNLCKEKEALKGLQVCLFTKFIMLINILFQISYVFTEKYDSGLKVKII